MHEPHEPRSNAQDKAEFENYLNEVRRRFATDSPEVFLRAFANDTEFPHAISYLFEEKKLLSIEIPDELQRRCREKLFFARMVCPPIVRITDAQRMQLILRLIGELLSVSTRDSPRRMHFYLLELLKHLEVYAQDKKEHLLHNIKYFIYKYITLTHDLQTQAKPHNVYFVYYLTAERLQQYLTTLERFFRGEDVPANGMEWCARMREMDTMHLMMDYIKRIDLQAGDEDKSDEVDEVEKLVMLRALVVFGEHVRRTTRLQQLLDVDQSFECVRNFVAHATAIPKVTTNQFLVLRKKLRYICEEIERTFNAEKLQFMGELQAKVRAKFPPPSLYSSNIKIVELSDNIEDLEDDLTTLLYTDNNENISFVAMQLIEKVKRILKDLSARVVKADMRRLRFDTLKKGAEKWKDIREVYQTERRIGAKKRASCKEILALFLLNGAYPEEYRTSKLEYLDVEYPLLQGFDLRNHLAHYNCIADALPIDIEAAMDWHVTHFGIVQKWMKTDVKEATVIEENDKLCFLHFLHEVETIRYFVSDCSL